MSSDGEYRSRFVNFEVLHYMQIHNAHIWDEVEVYLSKKTNIELSMNHYRPRKYPESFITKLKTNLSNGKYAIKFYVLTWITQALIKFLNVQNSHI